MDCTHYDWNDVTEDTPIPLIHRRLTQGETAVIARVVLKKGCHVATHNHISEQIAVIESGKVKWRLGREEDGDYREVIAEGGSVMILPPNRYHGVDALEETVIYDFLTPITPMGIDSQERAH